MKNSAAKIEQLDSKEERLLLPLLSLAENCAYSAKNHHKSADVMLIPRYSINAITTLSLFSIAVPYFQSYPSELQTFAVLASMVNLLLVAGLLSPVREAEYKTIGDDYLKLYRECFELYTSIKTTEEKRAIGEKLQGKYDALDRKHIGFVARRLSKRCLERRDLNDNELDLEWIRSEKKRLAHG